MLTSSSLAWREVVRFLRQRSRVMGALLSPLVLWVIIGSGIGQSFRSDLAPSGRGYLEYLFPGVILMTLLFTAIFATISIIEDRKEGFLKAVMVAPVPRSCIVMGKVVGTTILAVLQGGVLLILAPMVGITFGLSTFLWLVFLFALVSFGLAALGFAMAWHFRSIQGFHAVMNLVLLPMWFLSGALFPSHTASSWMSALMVVNPLTYGMAAIRRALYPEATMTAVGLPSMSISLIALTLFAVALFWFSFRAVKSQRILPE